MQLTESEQQHLKGTKYGEIKYSDYLIIVIFNSLIVFYHVVILG